MDDLIASAVSKLTQAGYHCRAAFPGFRLPQLESPMVVVSLSEFTLRPAACGDYIGTNAALTGFYGERFDGVLQFEVYSPFRTGGSVCTEGVFFGTSAMSNFNTLLNYLQLGTSMTLTIPGRSDTFPAILVRLELTEEACETALHYRFVFVQTPT